jgi:hypothetical protein
MAKQLEIQLKFTTGGSAEKLLEKLDLLATAQRSLSRNQRQFNNANLKAVKAFKQLTQAEEKHRFAMLKTSTQIAKLKEQLRVLRMRNKALEVQLKKNAKAQDRFRISTSGLQRRIGALRNKILLVTFAFGGMAAGIRSSIQTSMEFEAVQVRLNSMFGSVRAGERAFQKFNQVAATTPFTLTDVVEAGAALKAFGTNAEEMIKPTADLAAFMGVTATEAAQALGRAFAGGAGAADILRERGILQLIRDTKGIDDLSKMTLPAFRKALQETLLDPEVGIAGATDKLSQTMVGAVSNMADAFTRMKAAIGDFIVMKGIVQGLAESFSDVAEFFKQMNETPQETTIRKLKELNQETADLELANEKIKLQQIEQEGNAIKLAEANKLIAPTKKELIDINNKIAAQETSLTKALQDEEKIVKNLGEAKYQEILTAIKDSLAFDIERRDTLENQKELAEKSIEHALKYEATIRKIAGLEEEIAKTKAEQVDLGFAFSFDPNALIAAYSNFRELNEAEQKIMDEEEILRLQTREQLFNDHFNKVLNMAQQNINAQKQAELSALRDTDAYRNASAEKRQDMERDALKRLQKQQNTIFKINQANEIIKVILSSMSTASKIKDMQDELEALAVSMYAVGNVKAGNKATAGAVALKAQRGLVIASGAAQAGLIAGQKPPAFARGGSFITGGQQMIMVGDNAGGRERVDITPLSSPDFGDAGGGGSINVNIMGNVIGTQEFVRDSLLPEIENTIRRNLA